MEEAESVFLCQSARSYLYSSFLDMKASEMLAVLFVLVYSRSYTTLAGEVI